MSLSSTAVYLPPQLDYRGERCKDFNEVDVDGVPMSLTGNNLLIFNKPDMVRDIHIEYFTAGLRVEQEMSRICQAGVCRCERGRRSDEQWCGLAYDRAGVRHPEL